MRQTIKSSRWIYLSVGLIAMSATPLWADEEVGNGSSKGMDFSYSGSVRYESAVATGNENPFNQRGNLFNGEAVSRNVILSCTPNADPTLPCTPVPTVNPAFAATRNGVPAHNVFNMQLIRGELRGDWRITNNLNFVGKLRAIFDPGAYQEFDPAAVGSQAQGRLYGEPNYFRYDVEGKNRANPLEWAGRYGMVDFPSLYLSYSNGPLLVKLGNQDIAWGQAIYFRVLDVPNGLDLRRHSVLDYASEEFQDKRVPSLALRASYQFESGWLADGYVQKFQPTVLSNPNTPYNIIASQFTIHDRYGDVDNKLNYGLRLKGDIGKFGVQAMAARRYNPDGVYRWTASGVNRSNATIDGYVTSKFAPPGAPTMDAGPILASSPFEIDSTGVWSAKEWFTYAAMSRLDGVEGLNAAATDFPTSVGGLLSTIGGPATSVADANDKLDSFFFLSGSGLRGHLAREYRAETNLGLGASYVTEGNPGSWADQLIINVEAMYTPDRTFTDPSLRKEFLKENDLVTAVVMEKYQSIFKSTPATYVVAQWMHRTNSDLLGRSLKGQGGDVNNQPAGKSSYDALAFALQQPFPNLIWRADLAVLYEPSAGGILVQPGVRWKPTGALTLEAFYNYLDGNLNGNPNSSSIATFGSRDEVTMRLAYQF